MLRYKDGPLHRISQLHPLYIPLCYPLLYPHGEQGWHPNMPLNETEAGRQRSCNGKITQTLYYSYQLFKRHTQNGVSALLRGGLLLQEYICDAWASTEQSRLNWIRQNQTTIRADIYSGVQDAAIQGDNDMEQVSSL